MEINVISTLIDRDLNHNIRNYCEVKKAISKKKEILAIKAKYPSKIPLIVEKYHKERSLPDLDKNKFLVPSDITMSQFLVIMRNRLKIRPSQALYLIINNKSMLSMSLTMAQAYESLRDDDGFLYVTYASQEVFGHQIQCTKETEKVTGVDEIALLRIRFPNKVPLFVERYSREREAPAMVRKKFLVPQELTMSQFLFIIRTKIRLRNTQALYLIINDRVVVSNSMTMAQAYEQFRSHDGMLHITYATQQVFG